MISRVRIRDRSKCRSYSATYRAKNLAKVRAANRRYAATCKDKRRITKLMMRYGLRPDQYDAMAKAQSYLCAICNKSLKLYVDHHKASGVVRGLLCRDCNLGLGYFKESPDALSCAAKYLAERHEMPLHEAQTRKREPNQLAFWSGEPVKE
ncbi:endonuclease domain-containing protein [Bradyrhizobium sp. CCGUVB1N3]|uniref:endonuclease domain-containing protein n=1 Tax=Bradyrhizobium sp. CCGUVB1N3 TaxID=2949629 RepID=UPI0035320B77